MEYSPAQTEVIERGLAPPPVGSPGRRLERVRDVQEDGEGSENDQEALCER